MESIHIHLLTFLRNPRQVQNLCHFIKQDAHVQSHQLQGAVNLKNLTVFLRCILQGMDYAVEKWGLRGLPDLLAFCPLLPLYNTDPPESMPTDIPELVRDSEGALSLVFTHWSIAHILSNDPRVFPNHSLSPSVNLTLFTIRVCAHALYQHTHRRNPNEQELAILTAEALEAFGY